MTVSQFHHLAESRTCSRCGNALGSADHEERCVRCGFHTYRYDAVLPGEDPFWPCGSCAACEADPDVRRHFDTGGCDGLWTK